MRGDGKEGERRKSEGAREVDGGRGEGGWGKRGKG